MNQDEKELIKEVKDEVRNDVQLLRSAANDKFHTINTLLIQVVMVLGFGLIYTYMNRGLIVGGSLIFAVFLLLGSLVAGFRQLYIDREFFLKNAEEREEMLRLVVNVVMEKDEQSIDEWSAFKKKGEQAEDKSNENPVKVQLYLAGLGVGMIVVELLLALTKNPD